MKKIIIFCLIAGFVYACGGQEQSSSSKSKSSAATKKSAELGKSVYKTYCLQCHGAKGNLRLNGASDLTISELSLIDRIEVISNGRNTMLPYKNTLNDKQIAAVSRYLETLIEK